MIKLTNISGGCIVCNLIDGETLRLRNKESVEVEQSRITKHINFLIDKGLMLKGIEEVKIADKMDKKNKEKEV